MCLKYSLCKHVIDSFIRHLSGLSQHPFAAFTLFSSLKHSLGYPLTAQVQLDSRMQSSSRELDVYSNRVDPYTFFRVFPQCPPFRILDHSHDIQLNKRYLAKRFTHVSPLKQQNNIVLDHGQLLRSESVQASQGQTILEASPCGITNSLELICIRHPSQPGLRLLCNEFPFVCSVFQF